MSNTLPPNPDHVLVRRFLESPTTPVEFDCTELSSILEAKLVRADLNEGILEVAYHPPRLFSQGLGVLQGGVIMTMLDFAMALAVMGRLPLERICSTISLNVNFLRPAKPARYRAVARPERIGRTIAFARATLHLDPSDELVATATSSLAISPRS
jgi:uncharacterized protein (TIGR00369 family)